MQSTKRSVSINCLSQIYCQFTTIGLQVVVFPALLYLWGIDKFADWLILSVLPTYLCFTDFGLTVVLKNRMSVFVVQNRIGDANNMFQTVFAGLTAIVLMVLAILFAVYSFFPSASWLGLIETSSQDGLTTILLLSISVLLYQFILLACAVLRAIAKPAEEAIWAANSRLLDGVAVVGVAFVGGELVLAAAMCCVTKILVFCLLYARVAITAPWVHWSFSSFRSGDLIELFPSAISYSVATSGAVLLLHAPVFLLGVFRFAELIVAFSAMRTLTRVILSAGNVVTNSFAPQYSILFGLEDRQRLQTAIKVNMLIVTAIAIGFATIALCFGDEIVQWWTMGGVHVDYPILLLLVIASSFELLWTSLFTVLTCCNKHFKPASWFTVMAIGAVGVAAMLGYSGNPSFIVLPVAFCHFMMFVVCAFSCLAFFRMPLTLMASDSAQ